MSGFSEPSKNCNLCPRLAGFRDKNRHAFPDKHNAPVSSFGSIDAPMLVVGLAPGLRGANFTGRPFTGDYAGDLLYKTLLKFGYARGKYEGTSSDNIELIDCRITNAVRCVPPENKPTGSEISRCQSFLYEEFNAMPKLTTVIALGKIAHDAVLRTFGEKLSAHKFTHGAKHQITDNIVLFDSYHCSRYNVNTGRLSEDMFFQIFSNIKNQS